ncbi:MAG: hypothetical protein ACXVCY_03870 [Pseudobdellovibrionaceae bacterium]
MAYFVYNESPYNLNPEVSGGKPLDEVKISRRPIRDFGIQGMLDFLKVNFFERWIEFRSDSDYKKADLFMHLGSAINYKNFEILLKMSLEEGLSFKEFLEIYWRFNDIKKGKE